MKPEDELCLCFHVTRRKVENFLRVERPRTAAQLADCYGAGTGCGWCRPLLRKLFDAHASSGAADAPLPTPEEHALGRAGHLRRGDASAPPDGS